MLHRCEMGAEAFRPLTYLRPVRCEAAAGISSSHAESHVRCSLWISCIKVVVLIEEWFVPPEHRHTVGAIRAYEPSMWGGKEVIQLDPFRERIGGLQYVNVVGSRVGLQYRFQNPIGVIPLLPG